MIVTKRIYEPAAPGDGVRVLVDRLWPRGIAKNEARIDHWLKELAPSTALRQWFHNESGDWQALRSRYFRELDQNPEAVSRLLELAKQQTVTLLYAARDQQQNNAVALQQYLEEKLRESRNG